MDRKFLEGLGLDKDAVDKVMTEHGKAVTAEQAKTTAMTNERDTLQGQLDAANKEIKGYKDLDIDAIKKSVEDWKQKAEDGAKELENVRQEASLDKALASTPTLDPDLLKKVLNHEDLQFKDGEIIGLDAQVQQLQKDKPYLFKDEGQKEAQGEGDNGFDPFLPPAAGGEGNAASQVKSEINEVFGFKD